MSAGYEADGSAFSHDVDRMLDEPGDRERCRPSLEDSLSWFRWIIYCEPQLGQIAPDNRRQVRRQFSTTRQPRLQVVYAV